MGWSLTESVSDDFCSEQCQTSWLMNRATSFPVDAGQEPDTTRPRVAPVRPLTFLGDPPPGAIAKEGHEVLDEVAAFVGRFSAFPDEHCVPTLALWYAHTHVVNSFYITPRLVLDSAEPGSGKTRVLEVAAHLVAAPEMTISATPAALFRMVSAGPVTILFDEVDAIFGGSGGGGNEDLRALLNAGYKHGATVARCAGDAKAMEVQRFAVFAPAALAGIAGNMPDTITTRAVTIHMRRRRIDQTVEPYRYRTVVKDAKPIREALTAWTHTLADTIGAVEPDMPDGVTDRAAEIWEPLLALADAAGGHWPDTARAACVHFVLNSGPPTLSHGVRLLADLRDIYHRHNAERLPPPLCWPTCATSMTPRGETSTASPWTRAGWPANSAATASKSSRSSTTATPSRATPPTPPTNPPNSDSTTPGAATCHPQKPTPHRSVTAVTVQLRRHSGTAVTERV